MVKTENRPIAIIAIHGVADQLPTETALAAATLLQQNDGATYSAFERSSIRLRVEKPDSANHTEGKDLKFTSELLKDTEIPPDEAIYDTIRLSSIRRANDGSTEREIHVFEMYWGDLSHASNKIWQIFIGFYQLAFQIVTVGRETMKCACEQEQGNFALKLSRAFRDFCDHLLTRAIPVLNLCILWLALGLFPLAIPSQFLPVTGGIFAALATAGVFAFLQPGKGGWGWTSGIAIVLVVGVLATFIPWSSFACSFWLLLLGGLVLDRAWHSSDSRLPGTLVWGRCSQIFTVTLVAWGCIAAGPISSASRLPFGVLRGSDGLLSLLFYVWLLLYGAQVLLTLCSLIARWTGNPLNSRQRRRALWTGELSIFGPLLLVTFLNIAIWQSVRIGLSKIIPAQALTEIYYKPLGWCPGSSHVLKKAQEEGLAVDGSFKAGDFIDRQVKQSGFLFPYVGGLIGLGLLATIWGLLPTILLEISPLSAGPSRKSSIWHGRTLTAGYQGMRVAGEVMRGVMTIGTIASIPIMLDSSHRIFGGFNPIFQAPQLGPVLSIVGLATVGLIFGSGIYQGFALGFRVVLDVALDVINWLREHPSKTTVRGRTFARYIALLRYLTEYQHRAGTTGYDTIVVLAHSQGTVITADILRFLKANNRALNLPPIDLFTMGCPLRQLYSIRFPGLYGWAGENSEARYAEKGPDPDKLGVRRWWNTYRSGDYVGRYLWQTERNDGTWETNGFQVNDSVRREWCLGAGAHTHYWDECGAEVGKSLDELVASADAMSDSVDPAGSS